MLARELSSSPLPPGVPSDDLHCRVRIADQTFDRRLLSVLLLVALNLRPLLTSISPLLSDIKAATGMSFGAASLLTVLPVLAMGIVALAGVRMNRWLGDRRGIALGLLAIAIACAGRFVID